jgi:putative ABC transport system permease protein
MFMNLWFDLKYAWRLLLKTPGHSLLCSVVVALSVGLSMWSYELYYGLALKSLPFPGSERWLSIQVASRATGTPQPALDAYTYQELLGRTGSLDHLGAFVDHTAVLSEGDASTSLRAALTTPDLLPAMRVAPLLGRLFDAADARPGAAPAVILSFDTWQNYFAADPAVVGRQARIDAQPMQIVGVMPQGFYFLRDVEVWLPWQRQNLAAPDDSAQFVAAFATLLEGRSAAAAVQEMQTVVEEVNRNYSRVFNADRRIALIPAHRMTTHGGTMVAAMINFMALAVLLLGCVNIGLMLFARLLERSRELALRVAVGSSRWRLMRQCLLESVFIVLVGLVLGIALAALGARWNQSLADFGVQVRAGGRPLFNVFIRFDGLVAAVLAATALWLLSTLIPAWRIARQDAALTLAGGGKGVTGQGRARGAGILVGVQVMISCLVLVVCANLAFAMRDELGKPTGLSTAQVMVSLYSSAFGGRYATPAERLQYWDELTATIVSRMPGVKIAYADALPGWPANAAVSIEHQEGVSNEGALRLPLTEVSDDYFELLGIKLLAGRTFDSTDNDAALDVAVVDENAVRNYWPGQAGRPNDHEHALGKRIQLDPGQDGPWLTIVGVVAQVARPYNGNLGVIYRPLHQMPPPAFHLIAKLPSRLDAGTVADARAKLREAAFAVDRDLPLHNLQRFDDYWQMSHLGLESMTPISAVISIITVILAGTGLFGLISRSVARRTQEIGVRRALGSTQWQVALVFLQQGALYLSIGFIGIALGILISSAFPMPNVMVKAVPVTIGVLVLMSCVIFGSSYLPTRRAVALEPGDALRYE